MLRMEAEKLEDRFALVESTARESGSFIVTAVLPREDSVGYRVQMSLEQFLLLLSHCRPRVVYAFADEFDSRDSLLASLEVSDDNEAVVTARPDVKSLMKQAARHNGQLGSFLAGFLVDGVLHTVFEQTEWLDEFETRADDIEVLLNNQRQQELSQSSAAETAKTREHAKKLCGHPKFNDGRPSREKREYLARSLFPELDRAEISRVVEEATNMSWLAGG
jgi:hypothetical protein